MFDWLLCGLVTAAIVVPPALHSPASQDDRVTGTLTVDGTEHALRHVLARQVRSLFDKDKIVTQVLLTAQPVPEEALEDAFTLDDAVKAGRVTGLRLEYEDDGRSVTGFILSDQLGGMSMSISRSGSSAVPAELTATRIAGGFEWSTKTMDDVAITTKATWTARVRALPVVVEPTAADAAAALAHPAVQAWQAIEKAIHDGDKAALLKVAPAEVHAMAAEPDFDENFKMIKQMTPKVARYLRVTERNGKVIIEAEAPGLMDGQLKRGTITMVKNEAGVWWAETMTF